MKKVFACMMTIAMIAAMLTGCGSTQSNSGDTTPPADTPPAEGSGFDQEYTWDLSTTYATGTPIVDGLYHFAELLNEYSDGTITLNVFPDGTLYNEADAIMAVKSGELDFTDSGTIAITTHLPQYGFISAPFMVTTYDQIMTLWDSDLLQEAKTELEENYNTRNVGGLAYRGFRNMSSNVAVSNVDDIQGVLMRMNTNVVMNSVFNAIGAVCVPLSLNELYTSLQTGAVQSSEGPWEQMVSYNLYEVQDYIMETKHIVEASCIWMSNSLYESLPENYQEVVDRAAKEINDEIEKNCMAAEEAYKQTMIDNGCEVVECDISGFITKSESAWDQLFQDTWTGFTLDQVREAAGIQ